MSAINGLINVPAWLMAIALASIAFGAAVVIWAMFWDWLRRGRKASIRRCPRCWYDMAGASMTCPECGHLAATEKRLHRSRRRWVWAVLGALLIVSGVTVRRAHGLNQRDLVRKLPTAFLLSRVDNVLQTPARNQQGGYAAPDFSEEICRELWIRDFEGRLSESHRKKLAEKQFRGASPMIIRTRSPWPRDAPLTARVSTLFGGSRVRELRCSSPWPGSEVFTARPTRKSFLSDFLRLGLDGWEMIPSALSGVSEPTLVNMGIAPPGADRVRLDGVIREGDFEVWAGAAVAPIKLVDTVDEAITPDESSKLQFVVERLAKQPITVGEDFRSVAFSPLDMDQPPSDLVVAIHAEFIFGGEVKASCSLVLPFRDAADRSGFRRNQNNEPPLTWARLQGSLPADIAQAEGWTLRLKPDTALALANFEAQKYWKGEVSAPLPKIVPPQPLVTGEW